MPFQKLSNGESINYIEINPEGKKDVVFVHGNASSLEWWDDAINIMDHSKYHIIAIDQRGFGKSTWINSCNRFEHWAKDLK